VLQDLLRQLQQATRRMENINGKPADSMSIGSVGSQDGSCGSLETTGLTVTNCAELTPRVCVLTFSKCLQPVMVAAWATES